MTTPTYLFNGTDIGLVANDYMRGVTNIDTIYDMPTIRGNNKTVPLKDGSVFTEKSWNGREITLGFLVRGISEEDFETRVDNIKKLFGKRSLQTLTRVMASGSRRQIDVEVVPPLQAKQDSHLSVRMTVDMESDEPFFRGTSAIQVSQVATASANYFNIVNSGMVEDKSAIIEFKGPLENPRLTNQDNGIWVGINGSISAGVTIEVDVGELDADSRLDDVEHSGDAYFMVLGCGTNSMKLETDTTGGNAVVTFYPPYL